MILPRLRKDLDVMPSPLPDRPGLLIRDTCRFSDAKLIIPPLLMPGLGFFDGVRGLNDLRADFAARTGKPEMAKAADHMAETLDKAGFLENETYARMRDDKRKAFAQNPAREPAHAGSAYPTEPASLQDLMRRYLGGGAEREPATGACGIAAPHVSPEGGWRSYRAAYHALTPDLGDRTFVILGTSHYGQPNRFGVTRKPFRTPYGLARTDIALAEKLAAQPAALSEDYCHAIEHSIEFQVLFLQALYGPDVKILPLLCGSFGPSIVNGGLPEQDEGVKRFFGALGEIAEKEKNRLFWVLGVDMAHMGARYRDRFEAQAEKNEMQEVRARDMRRIERINGGDAQGFWYLVRENRDDLKWCGTSPFYTFIKAVPGARGSLRRYEQWNIDAKSVVSFAGISFV